MNTTTVDQLTTDALEQQLIALESVKARICAEQIVLLREADRRQTPLADGSRSLQEWTAGRLDIAPETAKTLVTASRLLTDQPELEKTLVEGLASFDRILATSQLTVAGATPDEIAASAGFDIPTIRRLTGRHRHLTSVDERQTFSQRFLTMQPNLDATMFRLWGQLPGTDGELVSQALQTRADQFPPLPDGTRGNLGQRNADALISIAQDSLTTTTSGENTEKQPTGPLLSVFMDGNLAATTKGQAGSTTSSGVQVGLQTIEEILCNGSVECAIIQDGIPLGVGRTTKVIPPRLRRYIQHRDGGCTADGCTSRYRLQPHHVVPWSQGGPTDPDNLTLLCWFHHHVVIHQMGYEINPNSPPGRLRFKPPDRSPP